MISKAELCEVVLTDCASADPAAPIEQSNTQTAAHRHDRIRFPCSYRRRNIRLAYGAYLLELGYLALEGLESAGHVGHCQRPRLAKALSAKRQARKLY
jgi:hypothetical protein